MGLIAVSEQWVDTLLLALPSLITSSSPRISWSGIGEAPWNEPPTAVHHDQAVILTHYARLYDELADAIDHAAVVADSSRLVSQFLMVTVALGNPSTAAVNVNDDDVNWGSRLSDLSPYPTALPSSPPWSWAPGKTVGMQNPALAWT